MPYLAVKTNVAVAAESRAALLSVASREVAKLLGKPERYVMVSLEAAVPLLFAGSDAPAAYMELKSIGLPDDRTAEYSRALCDTVGSALGITRDRVYIEFSVAEPHLWGWNGETF